MISLRKITALFLSVSIFAGLMPERVCEAEEEKTIIVSIGDSYSAGEGIEPFRGQDNIMNKFSDYRAEYENDIQDWLAHRSEKCWPGQLEARGISGRTGDHRGENWYFAAASGAVISDFYHSDGSIGKSGECNCSKENSGCGQLKEYNLTPRYVMGKLSEAHKENTESTEHQALELMYNYYKFISDGSSTKADKAVDYTYKFYNIYNDLQRTYSNLDWEVMGKLGGSKNLTPQLDVLKELGPDKADYVTLTIGGNDARFTEVIKAATRPGFLLFKNVNALYDQLDRSWKDAYSENGLIDGLYDAYSNIQKTAGNKTKIIVAGYPQLLNPGGALAYPAENAVCVNNNVEKFNKIIQSVVNECRIRYDLNTFFVSVDEKDYFEGHQADSSEPYINSVLIQQAEDINGTDPVSSYSIHPNENGAGAYAAAVNRQIKKLDENGIIIGTLQKSSSDRKHSSVVSSVIAVNVDTGSTYSAEPDIISEVPLENHTKWIKGNDPLYYYELEVPPGSYKLSVVYKNGKSSALGTASHSEDIIKINSREVVHGKNFIEETTVVTPAIMDRQTQVPVQCSVKLFEKINDTSMAVHDSPVCTDGTYIMEIAADGYPVQQIQFHVINGSVCDELPGVIYIDKNGANAVPVTPIEVQEPPPAAEVPEESGESISEEEADEFLDHFWDDFDLGVDLGTPRKILYNDHLYALYDYYVSASWLDVIYYKTQGKAHLVTIDTEDEQKVVEKLIKAGERIAYITGGVAGTDRSVQWITEQYADYLNWMDENPEELTKKDTDNVLLDVVAVYRSLEKECENNARFGKWFELVETDWALLQFLDQSYNGQKIGIIIEWDSIS